MDTKVLEVSGVKIKDQRKLQLKLTDTANGREVRVEKFRIKVELK